MLTDVLKKEHVSPFVIQPEKATPVVSLFMPFEPKMAAKSEIVYKLQLLEQEAEQKLIAGYSYSTAEPVLKRLKTVVKNLDYSTHKKSVGIYVSAEGEKVFYLDMPLEERVIIDTSFNIRSLIEAKKSSKQYLVLVLGVTISRIDFGDGENLISMFTNACKKSHHKYISPLENLLIETDNNLNIMLNYFPSLPVFVLGNAYTLNRFKTITKNKTHITQLVETCNDDVTTGELKEALHPYIFNWDFTRMKYLNHTLANAMEGGKIAVGISNVRKAANRRTRLLVLEKDYTLPAVKAGKKTNATLDDAPFTDAVDEVIEKVLSGGGEVAFADKSVLKDYQHIALIYH